MTARFVFAAVSVIAFSTVLAGSASSQIAPRPVDALAELEAQQQPTPPPAPARGTQPRPGPAPQPNVIPPPVGQPGPTPSTAPAPPPRPRGQLVNVKVDLTITDQRSGAPPVKKTVSVMAADMELSRIRSISQFTPGPGPFGPLNTGPVPLNVDVLPRVEQGGKVRLMITLQYDLPAPPGDGKERGPVLMKTDISETLNVIVDDGKPLIVAQSADPVSDRQVTIEVRATILK